MEKFFSFIATPLLNQVLLSSLLLCRNVTLSYKIIGLATTDTPQPPVLLVHNIIGNKKLWDAIGKTILHVTHRSVVAIDLRNHGDSPHVNSHKYTHQASDVIKLIDKLGSHRTSLIGHGLGGKTAMCVALMAPQKVAGLQIIEVSPISASQQYNEYILKVLTAMKAVKFKNPKTVSEARCIAKNQLIETVGNEFIMKAALSNIVLKKDDTIGWTCNLDVLIKQYKHWVSFPKELKRKTYNGPTLFLGGQKSDLIPSKDVKEIKVLFPKAVVVYIPNAGHHVQVDDPKTFLEITISFLKTHTCDES